MPTCPDCGLAWGGFVEVPTICLACSCARAEGKQAAKPLNPWATPAPPPPEPKPVPLQAASTVPKVAAAKDPLTASAAHATAASKTFGEAAGQAAGHYQPPSNVWISSGAVMAGSHNVALGHEALQHGAQDDDGVCTCGHHECEHDRLGCEACDTCDAFVLQAAADAIEEAGSMDPADYGPVRGYVNLKDGRRVSMDDIMDASRVLVRRAQDARPARPLPQHRRGLHLRGINAKKEEA